MIFSDPILTQFGLVLVTMIIVGVIGGIFWLITNVVWHHTEIKSLRADNLSQWKRIHELHRMVLNKEDAK